MYSMCLLVNCIMDSLPLPLSSYLELMHAMQLWFQMEPAGSHGVWGLDDFQTCNGGFGHSQATFLVQAQDTHTSLPENLLGSLICKVFSVFLCTYKQLQSTLYMRTCTNKTVVNSLDTPAARPTPPPTHLTHVQLSTNLQIFFT